MTCCVLSCPPLQLSRASVRPVESWRGWRWSQLCSSGLRMISHCELAIWSLFSVSVTLQWHPKIFRERFIKPHLQHICCAGGDVGRNGWKSSQVRAKPGCLPQATQKAALVLRHKSGFILWHRSLPDCRASSALPQGGGGHPTMWGLALTPWSTL